MRTMRTTPTRLTSLEGGTSSKSGFSRLRFDCDIRTVNFDVLGARDNRNNGCEVGFGDASEQSSAHTIVRSMELGQDDILKVGVCNIVAHGFELLANLLCFL